MPKGSLVSALAMESNINLTYTRHDFWALHINKL